MCAVGVKDTYLDRSSDVGSVRCKSLLPALTFGIYAHNGDSRAESRADAAKNVAH